MKLADRSSWTNWAGNQSCAPARIARPASESELVDLVKAAAAAGQRVKAVGSGHSFTSIACTDGVLVDLSGLGRVLGVEPATPDRPAQVTVEAGIKLHRLSDELDARGLALQNMGDIDRQSISGATQTGTHGTGLRFGNLSTQIIGMRLVTADGSVLDLSAEREPRHVRRRPGRPRRPRHRLDGDAGLPAGVPPPRGRGAGAGRRRAAPTSTTSSPRNDHFEFYWVPHTRWALTKRNQRTDDAAAPRPAWREWVDDVVLQNVRLRDDVPGGSLAALADPPAGQDHPHHGPPGLRRPFGSCVHEPTHRAILGDGVRRTS